MGVAGGLVIGFLALLVIVGATVWLGERSNTLFQQTASQRDTRIASVELRDSLRTAESSQRGYLLTGNEIYLAPYDTAKARARQQMSDLERFLASAPQPPPFLPRLREAVDEKLGEMDESIALKRAGSDFDALSIIRSNRGKALMDEINVFLYGAMLDADEKSTSFEVEQQHNAATLRWVSIAATFVIVLVVAAVAFTVYRNRQEIAQARDEVRAINLTLEERVESRTHELALARERAEVLLSEVNHRVANSLQLVAALVHMQSKTVTDESARGALQETESRIQAISQIHKSLYTSSDVTSVALNDYLGVMLDNLGVAMRNEGHTAQLTSMLEPVSLPTDQSISLGVVATELVTNAFKYAYPAGQSGEIRVVLRRLPEERAELVVQDDGVGLGGAERRGGTGLGSKIIAAMAAALKTNVEYINRAPGTAARLVFSTAQTA
ncbi:CHASE3 domain-containing protein [Phenylobacterium sp.]|uniref:CHASE3 domain-containing protein n=1 Tax=Phenylobacterium sp. TaxID=1871053 RepID=UPI002F95A427